MSLVRGLRTAAVTTAAFILSAVSFGQLQTGAPWPCQAQNLQNTCNGVATSAQNSVKWDFSINGNINEPPAVSKDNRLYIPSLNGNLYCLTDQNGTFSQNWILPATGTYSGTPAIAADGTVFFGNGTLLAALTDNGSSATVINFVDLGSTVGSPTIGPDGTVYVGSSAGILYAYQLAGGTLQQIWTYTTGGSVNGPPAMGSDGTIYFGSDDGYLYALNSNGTLKWRYSQGTYAGIPVIGSDGTIYFSSGSAGQLYAITDSGTSGTLKWVYNFGSTLNPQISIHGSTIYVAPQGGRLAALQDLGAQAINTWTFKCGNVFWAPSIGSDGTLYFEDDTGIIYSLADNSSSYSIVWQHQAPDTAGAGIAIGSDGTLYCAFFDGSVIAMAGTATSSLSVTPNVIYSGSQYSSGLVTLNRSVAGSAGASVTLSSSSSDVVMPGTVLVKQGHGTASFTIGGVGVASPEAVTITATYGTGAATSTLTLLPATLSSVKLLPSSVLGSLTGVGEVTLLGKAPPAGTAVSLASDNSAATVPATVTVPAGTNYVYFQIGSTNVAYAQTVNISATLNGIVVSKVLNVYPRTSPDLKLSTTSTTGGSSLMGECTLGMSVSSLNVSLTSSSADVQVPSQVTFTNANYVYFNITTSPVSSSENVVLSAQLGTTTIQRVLTLNPIGVASIRLASNSVKGGQTVYASVALTGKAPSNITVSLQSGGSVATLADSATVLAGNNYVYVPITTSAVTTTTTVTITASVGTSSASTTLTITP